MVNSKDTAGFVRTQRPSSIKNNQAASQAMSLMGCVSR
uniref:Uncharacterized protein n=1 Tax=Anguilla anguilla TaxID=7936 RepID=A0A0E9SUM0_ANGAN